MEVILRIDDGPEKGREFCFKEADNLLIGRQDPTSKAHVNIGPEDPYISRHHFMIEVRPPNCLIRDNGSTNGVFIRHKGRRKWERIEEHRVSDGDQIKIGKTILGVTVKGLDLADTPVLEKLSFLEQEPVAEKQSAQEPIAEKPVAQAPEPREPASQETASQETIAEEPPASEPPAQKPVAEPEEEPVVEPLVIETPVEAEKPAKPSALTCIRCGAALTTPPVLATDTIHDLDFMCSRCKAEVEAEKKAEEAKREKGRIRCQGCGLDITETADLDNRATELEGYAFYYCQACAKNAQKIRPQEIGGYLLIRELGRGGMGEVYQAWHIKTGRVVALKRLLPMMKVNNEQVLRFMREVNIMNELIHPGLVRLFEAGQQGENSFFISEFVPDGNLSQFVSAAGAPLLAVDEAVQLIIESLEALSSLHRHGYVHRDIKPENILIKRVDGVAQPKLTDFGLARSYERHGGTITKSGECAGTLMYMPPEQVLGFKNSKPPVDIYAMGVTLYYLLSGKYSLKFPTQAERNRGIYIKKDPVLMILEDEPVPIQERRADLPVSLCSVVNKAVNKESGQRYQTAEEFATALARAV